MLDRITNPFTLVLVARIKTEVIRRGTGGLLVLLHPEIGFAADEPVIDSLARQFDVIAPSHPGFGHSEVPDWMTIVEDLSYFYPKYWALDLDDVVLVGIAFGGWIAAELAVKPPRRVSYLVLADPAGSSSADATRRDWPLCFRCRRRSSTYGTTTRRDARGILIQRPQRTIVYGAARGHPARGLVQRAGRRGGLPARSQRRQQDHDHPHDHGNLEPRPGRIG
jgi:pimeloyl-ACP methyl ester carboxylesterase